MAIAKTAAAQFSAHLVSSRRGVKLVRYYEVFECGPRGAHVRTVARTRYVYGEGARPDALIAQSKQDANAMVIGLASRG